MRKKNSTFFCVCGLLASQSQGTCRPKKKPNHTHNGPNFAFFGHVEGSRNTRVTKWWQHVTTHGNALQLKIWSDESEE